MSLFIIVGLVLFISVAVLLLAAQAVQPEAPAPDVTSDVSRARTCLSRVTDRALLDLADDGVLTQSEAGPLPDPAPGEPSHLHLEASADSPFGAYNHLGLCATDGPNALDADGGPLGYRCPQSLYHRGDGWSVQEMLMQSITLQMRTCLEQENGTAEVIMRPDSVVVLWDAPRIEHTQQTALQTAYRAVTRLVRDEWLFEDHAVGPTGTCAGCEAVTFENIHPATADERWNAWRASVGGSPVVTVQLADRAPVYDNGTHFFSGSVSTRLCSVAPGESCSYLIRLPDDEPRSEMILGTGVLLPSGSVCGADDECADVHLWGDEPPFTVEVVQGCERSFARAQFEDPQGNVLHMEIDADPSTECAS